MKKVALVIIFNHRYDENIEILKAIYKNRFSTICMLIPFYDGQDTDIIPVYESSYQFQGYLIQAYEKLVGLDAEYYVFLGDDCLLSPFLNENNILAELNLLNKSIFAPILKKLNGNGSFEWMHAKSSSQAFLDGKARWEGSLPTYEEAIEKFETFFSEPYKREYDKDFFGNDGIHIKRAILKKKLIKEFIVQNGGTNRVPYPMAYGYSDIFVVKRESLFNISRISGVFAGLNLFAEIALPTAIVLTSLSNEVVCLKDTKYKMDLYWRDNRGNFENRYNYQLSNLYSSWEENLLCIHPVKLSKWKNDIRNI